MVMGVKPPSLKLRRAMAATAKQWRGKRVTGAREFVGVFGE